MLTQMFLRRHYTTVSCSVACHFDENKNAPSITGHVAQPVPYEDSSFTCHGWFRMLGQNDIDDLLGVCIDENDIRKVTFRAKFEEPR